MKLFKNKKGSILVERILMVAFSVAAGGAVVVYGTNVINDAKNTEITGILSGLNQEEIAAHFDDDNQKIIITASELNSKSFPALATAMTERQDYYFAEWNNPGYQNPEIHGSLIYNDITFYSNFGLTDEANFIHFTSDGYKINNRRLLIGFAFRTSNWNDLTPGRFFFGDDSDDWLENSRTFEHDLEWSVVGESYSDLKQALISDLGR